MCVPLLSGSSRQATRFHERQLRTNESFDLIPNHGIAFHFSVGFGENTVVPRILVAPDRFQFIVKSKVSENQGARFIGGTNLGPAVESAIRLVEIRCVRNISGNQFVTFAHLGNAIHLDGKEHRDAISLQLSRERDCFGTAPAHPVDDDAGVLFLFGRECRTVVSVQELEDLRVRLLAAPILKHFDMDARVVVVAETPGKLDRAMDEVIVFDESAHETDHDHWRRCRTPACGREARKLILSLSKKAGTKKENGLNRKSHILRRELKHHNQSVELHADVVA